MDSKDLGRVLTDQALVVPVEPASRLVATRCDPSREYYLFRGGWFMRREGDGYQWHLRDGQGELVERDKYRHDLIERHKLWIVEHHDPVAIAIETEGGDAQQGSVAKR